MLKIAGDAIDNQWKPKAIDTMEMQKDIPIEECRKLVEELLGSLEIKQIFYEEMWCIHLCPQFYVA
ncbi:hypothetical protein NTE_01303 [Candidatus Nitrososphaera evergladensis SR1]|uniref:Uncharacterized protein n=1 Tax=Candidatus Nitrososphaera evergladensis SR1 TaxID=1459636 RepID=A0A075MRC8_9ARCH|nr:hypothetical protein [Candidatus Nitrososphaera evergladensis]AIF83372.1 hypothetical protein NTE_01303 [Candidatus Nitrososphaera evergladensis SR1]